MITEAQQRRSVKISGMSPKSLPRNFIRIGGRNGIAKFTGEVLFAEHGSPTNHPSPLKQKTDEQR